MYGDADKRKIGTSDWTANSIVLDVPTDAVAIFFGCYLVRGGRVWVSNLSLEIVDSSVAATGGWVGPAYETDPTEPKNLDFTVPPTAAAPKQIPNWWTGDNTAESAVEHVA